MKFSIASACQKGLSHEHNDDFVYFNEDLNLSIVCDGVSANGHGGTAAEICASEIASFLYENSQLLSELDSEQESGQRGIIDLLQNAAYRASEKLVSAARGKASLRGMATTMSMLLISGNKAFLGHVGDSRIYLCRQGRFHQLTRDHTIGNDLLEKGFISAEELERHPFRNALSKSFTTSAAVSIDTLMFDILTGDRIILCSDGFYETAQKDRDLWADVLIDNTRVACEKLIDNTMALEPADDVSLILIQAHESDKAQPPRISTDEFNLKAAMLQKVFLFQDLELKEVLKVMERVAILETKANESIIEEGSRATTLYVLLSGGVAVSKAGKHVATLHAGNHFGEMSLFEQQKRSASVRSSMDSRLLVMSKEDFTSLLKEDPQLGLKLMWRVAEELSHRLAASAR